MDLARPVLVDELPKGVDQWEEVLFVQRQAGLLRAAGPDLGDLKSMVAAGLGHEDHSLSTLLGLIPPLSLHPPG